MPEATEATGPNDLLEAYTGKLTGRKQATHPAEAIQPRDGTNTQAGTEFPFTEPNTSQSATGEGPLGLPGSQNVACEASATRNQGEPASPRGTNYECPAGRPAQRQEALARDEQAVRSVHINPEPSRLAGAGSGQGADRGSQPVKETSAVRATELHWPTTLRAIAKKAKEQKQYRFGGLYRLIDERSLRACFFELRRDAAPGVDEGTWQDYREHLDENLRDLVGRLKAQRYRARLVRRKYIPKGEGKFRPLAIAVLEDKLVQAVVANLLLAIYEADFLPCNYGYRPHRGAQPASRWLAGTLSRGGFEFVVEADSKGFFEHVQGPWLLKMLSQRIADGALLGLISKWLKAGIVEEDGQIIHPATGTPQGGIVSPVLANVYLHYVLDLWFERRVRKQNRGACLMVRYADDFVCAFAWRHEAQQFMDQLKERLAKFGLEVASDKTRLLRFGRHGGPHNGRFDFLGFEFYWKPTRTGRRMVQRRTARQKLRKSVAAFTEWIRAKRHLKLKQLMKTLGSKYRGYWNDYGVRGNSQSLEQFYQRTRRILLKWLNRRSQRRSYTGRAFERLLRRFQIPKPRIVEPMTLVIERPAAEIEAALNQLFRRYNGEAASV